MDKETLLNAQEHPGRLQRPADRVAGYTATLQNWGRKFRMISSPAQPIPRQAVAVNPTDCERRSVLRHALVPLWQKGKEYHKP